MSENLILFLDDHRRPLSKIDSALTASVKGAVDFQGKYKETTVLYPSQGCKRLLLVGMGATQKVSGHQLRSLMSHSIQTLKNLGQTKASCLLPTVKSMNAAEVAQALGEGAEISQLNFFDFKTDRKPEDKNRYVKFEIELLAAEKKDAKSAAQGWERGQTIGQGVNWGRHLVMTPGSHLTPADLAKSALKMVQSSPSKAKIKSEVWTEKELAKNKFGGILGVGQGSSNPPRFIILQYWGGKKSDAPIALVGKGVTFDSGGLSLKPPQGMETMKYDMAGAATVLSAFKIVTDLKLSVNLLCFVPSAENMPSGTAQRPGDVLHMASGRTVEVLNTDAEGRLILADALYWATSQFKPRVVVDVATLTGACAAAVGEAAAGVFANSKKVLSALLSSAESTQEGLWPLPQYPEVYGPMVKSDIADIKNTGGKYAGASTASMFLQYFVQNETPWAHLDIAGCGWYDSPRDFVTGRGASGVPIRTLAEFVESHSTSKFN